MRRRLGTSLYAGLLFTVLGAIAWATGQPPFVFPSLGPSAFLLAFDRRSERGRAARIVGSHLIGGVAGLTAWWLIAPGASLTATAPAFSPAGFRLAASATVSRGDELGDDRDRRGPRARLRDDADRVARAPRPRPKWRSSSRA